MTCAEYRQSLSGLVRDFTRAERAAVAHHYLACPACGAATDAAIDAERAADPAAAVRTRSAVVAADLRDPEYLAVALAGLGRLAPDRQARLDALADKCERGRLTLAERREYTALADELMVMVRANARAILAARAALAAPPPAEPDPPGSDPD